jgi:hypothetical protein
MIYGLKTVNEGIIFQSRFLDDVLAQMKHHPNSYIVEIEEKSKHTYSKDF